MIKPYDIIAILMIVGLELLVHLPQKTTQRVKHLTGCKSNLKTIGTALEIYASDNDGEYPTSLSGISSEYIGGDGSLPTCPAGGTYVLYTGEKAPYYSKETKGQYFYLECHGKAHENQDRKENFPAYSAYSGLIENDPNANR